MVHSSFITSYRMGALRFFSSTAAMASSAPTARDTWLARLSETFRSAEDSMVKSPRRCSSLATPAAPLPQARRRVSSSVLPPWAHRASRTRLSRSLAPETRAVSRSTDRVHISRSRYQSPAGSSTFTAVYRVQKYRSRSQRASLICWGPRTLSSSRTSVTAFSPSRLPSCPTVRTKPSLVRFPLPKGTATRTPGRTFPASFSGIR